MTEEEERAKVHKLTELHRQAIPVTVILALADMSVTLDDVLKMSRKEFEAIDHKVYEKKVSDDDRTHLIRFKHRSLTHLERLAYFEKTQAEMDEIEDEEI